jgi:putative heme-binding domain-containing protein
MPGGNYGYHPRGKGQTHWHEEQPGVVPKILRTYFGSPTGMCVYEGTLLPKKYWGQLLHVDAGPRQVRCYHLKPKGAGYDVDREDMVTSTDNWFRPSDICVAPDGSVFVADWYDPGVGGHGMGDTTRGRVFRLAPKGNKSRVPKVDLATNKGIVAALGSPALSVRYMAMSRIRSLPKCEASEVIGTGWGSFISPWGPLTPSPLMARLFAAMYDIEPDFDPVSEIEDLDMLPPTWKRFFVKLWLQYFRHLYARFPDLAKAPGPIRETLKHLNLELLNSGNTLAAEILLALRSTEASFARPIILDLAEQYDGKDRFYLEAIGIAVGRHDKKRRDIILADFEKKFPEWNDKVADLVWELQPPSVMPSLGQRLTDTKLTAEQKARVVDILAVSDDPGSGKTLLAVMQNANLPGPVRVKALENLKLFLPGKWSALQKTKELADVIASLLAKGETRIWGLDLIGAAGKTDAAPAVKELAASAVESADIRKAAVHTLGSLSSAEAVTALAELLGDKSVMSDALDAIGKQVARRDNPGAKPAMSTLQDVVTGKERPGDLRKAALSALAGTRRGTTWLLELNEKGGLDPALKDDTARLLRNSSYIDLRNKAMLAFPPPGRLDPKKLPSPAVLAQRRGDVARGKKLLAASLKNDMQCLKCHSALGTGGQVGPDLSMIGKKASRENLFESILYPSKAIADQYVTWLIETKKGTTLSGLIVEETVDSVTVRDGNGKDAKIPKAEIEGREKSPKSLMPDDLLVYMTEDDLVDIVEYLFTLR